MVTVRMRLDRLEELLDGMKEDNRTYPVLVEGKRDRIALTRLGLEGDILLLNVGRTMTDRVVEIIHGHGGLILLPDWDRKGEALLRRIEELVRAEDGRVVGDYWRALKPLVQKDIKAVEDMATLMEQLKEKVRA